MLGGATRDDKHGRGQSSNLAKPMREASETRPKRSLRVSFLNIYETLAISVPTIIDSALGRVTKEISDARLDSWARAVVAHAKVEIDVVGREHLEEAAKRSMVVMSNHQSLYDIPVVFRVFGTNMRMVTKKELFDVPIFGQALEKGGFIRIDRADRRQAIASLSHAKRVGADGTHVWIAPEGTRSQTGELLPFKKGGFNLALEEGFPIMPVSLVGTRDVLEARGVRSIVGQRVRVTLHAPIDTAPYVAEGKAGRNRLIERVRAAVQSGLEGESR
jgi:1-acyl-sn-glycerol-3-phosphate acyltransferase